MTLFLSIGLLYTTSAQDAKAERKAKRKSRPDYAIIGTGIDLLAFTDRATSPLTYSGPGAVLSLGRLRMDSTYEGAFNFHLAGGIFSTVSGSHSSASLSSSLFLSYGRMYSLPIQLSNKWDFKIGGEINLTGNIRNNPQLLNNQFGMEYFGNLLGQAKIIRDISRKNEKTLDLWLFKLKFKPKSRNLGLRLNMGLVNSYVRNGYSYTGQSQIINDYEVFDTYFFKAFSGFRLGYDLIYTRYLQNGNALKWTYTFDGMRTAPGSNEFGIAHNMITFALMFRIK